MIESVRQEDESREKRRMEPDINVGASGKLPYSAPVLFQLGDLRDITFGASPDGNESGGGGLFSVIQPFSGQSTEFEDGPTKSRSERSSGSDARRR